MIAAETGTGLAEGSAPIPLWLLAELTYRCPLQCAYCSNPIAFARYRNELSTQEWLDVLDQGRALGAVQLGLSGGEPLLRKDLETIVGHARGLGFYTNLLTSGVGLDEVRLARLKDAGLDHIQISFQADQSGPSDEVAGKDHFQTKERMARAIKAHHYPMVFNVVLHRHNLDRVDAILQLAWDLGADFVELANTQYHGWAYHNRAALMPTRRQLQEAEAVTERWREKAGSRMRIYFVGSDYYDETAKPCMNGWGTTFLGVAPDGRALPCHGATSLPIELPSVREQRLQAIWQDSRAFNVFRGHDWQPEPCASCELLHSCHGGCRCQALLLAGDAWATDPVCPKSALHDRVLQAVEAADRREGAAPLVMRTVANSRALSGGAAEVRGQRRDP
ncbi:pyrroloquinoline quinone biosynthesis protein PqqE [Arhodomonas sp. SL1]|uniref:pyrroloquinoline quinone biosynthesis protein PqqE n=1 Tax=Arhodomonas sp. SL1 TaxID=3425691 RepID=UPI003F88085F